MGNVGCLGRPWAHGAKARADDDDWAFIRASVRVAIGQQRCQLTAQRGIRSGVRGHQVHKTRCHPGNLVVNALQLRQELQGPEVAQGIAAVKCSDVQGHGVA